MKKEQEKIIDFLLRGISQEKSKGKDFEMICKYVYDSIMNVDGLTSMQKIDYLGELEEIKKGR